MWNVLNRVLGWLPRSNFTGREADGRRSGDVAGDGEAQLFHCADCEVTFIRRETAECPRCGLELDRIPNERELDRFRVH